ncbi:ParA family protein [Aeribacillus pallidus]|uniref:AAA domain-containing protein n=1 Tax=Aeribacillus pallidus TaxID=33936 RepID=A0A223E1G5_9BACI|nr:AAA family ATPase [Aeribacillus pallidus]ASS89020.1 hypothetical protein AP3564_00955 [Aeribacillus pallidus]
MGVAKVISFINMKGGVAKTTLTINIGEELANRGKKVLIIDMDPQFNATQSLLLHRTHLADQDKTFGDFSEEAEAEADIVKEITVNYHFISEQKSHFFAHSFRKPSPLF